MSSNAAAVPSGVGTTIASNNVVADAVGNTLSLLTPDAVVAGGTLEIPFVGKVGAFGIFPSTNPADATFFGTKPVTGPLGTIPLTNSPFALSVVGTYNKDGVEVGAGVSGKIPTPAGDVLLFINGRGGNVLSLFEDSKKNPDKAFTVSVNMGAALSVTDLAARGISVGTAGVAAPLVEAFAAAGDVWVGAAYRASLTIKNGQISGMKISGVDIPLDKIGEFFGQKVSNEVAESPRASRIPPSAAEPVGHHWVGSEKTGKQLLVATDGRTGSVLVYDEKNKQIATYAQGTTDAQIRSTMENPSSKLYGQGAELRVPTRPQPGQVGSVPPSAAEPVGHHWVGSEKTGKQLLVASDGRTGSVLVYNENKQLLASYAQGTTDSQIRSTMENPSSKLYGQGADLQVPTRPQPGAVSNVPPSATEPVGHHWVGNEKTGKQLLVATDGRTGSVLVYNENKQLLATYSQGTTDAQIRTTMENPSSKLYGRGADLPRKSASVSQDGIQLASATGDSDVRTVITPSNHELTIRMAANTPQVYVGETLVASLNPGTSMDQAEKLARLPNGPFDGKGVPVAPEAANSQAGSQRLQEQPKIGMA